MTNKYIPTTLSDKRHYELGEYVYSEHSVIEFIEGLKEDMEKIPNPYGELMLFKLKMRSGDKLNGK